MPSSSSAGAVETLLYNTIRDLQDQARTHGFRDLQGAAICLLDPEGEARIAVMDKGETAPAAVLSALALVYVAIDGAEDPHTARMLQQAADILDCVASLKSMPPPGVTVQ